MKKNLLKKEKGVIAILCIVVITAILMAMKFVMPVVKTAGITCSKGVAYQYDIIDKGDFKYHKGLSSYPLDKLPSSMTCVISSPTYNSSTLIITINGEDQKVSLDFIKATSLEWSYKGNDYIPDGTTVDSLKPEDFSCKITYEDGTSKEITPTTLSAKQLSSGAEVTLSDGVNTFVWNATVK